MSKAFNERVKTQRRVAGARCECGYGCWPFRGCLYEDEDNLPRGKRYHGLGRMSDRAGKRGVEIGIAAAVWS